jgi:tetratricopeptide (TPR) repeat protein
LNKAFREEGPESSGDASIMMGMKLLTALRNGPKRWMAGRLVRIGWKYFEAYDHVRARDTWLLALDDYRDLRDDEHVIVVACYVATAHYLLTDYAETTRFAGVAHQLASIHEDKLGLASALMLLSGAALKLGNVERALDEARQGHALAREVGIPGLRAAGAGNVAQALVVQGSYLEALTFVQESLGIMESLGETATREYALALNTLALIYRAVNEIQLTKETFQRALNAAMKSGDPVARSLLLSNASILHMAARQWDDALSMLEVSLPVSRALHDRHSEVIALVNKGLCLMELGSLQKAHETLEQARDLARTNGEYEPQWVAAAAISRVFRKLGQLERPDTSRRRRFRTSRSMAVAPAKSSTRSNSPVSISR